MNKIKYLLTSKFAALLLLLAFTVSTFAQTATSQAEKRGARDTYLGQTINLYRTKALGRGSFTRLSRFQF